MWAGCSHEHGHVARPHLCHFLFDLGRFRGLGNGKTSSRGQRMPPEPCRFPKRKLPVRRCGRRHSKSPTATVRPTAWVESASAVSASAPTPRRRPAPGVTRPRPRVTWAPPRGSHGPRPGRPRSGRTRLRGDSERRHLPRPSGDGAAETSCAPVSPQKAQFPGGTNGKDPCGC